MTVFTDEQDRNLAYVEDQAIRNAKTLLARDFTVAEVEGYLTRRVQLYPGIGLTRHACHGPHCTNTTDTPIRDSYATFWVGEQAETYCSRDCQDNAAEAYWTGRSA